MRLAFTASVVTVALVVSLASCGSRPSGSSGSTTRGQRTYSPLVVASPQFGLPNEITIDVTISGFPADTRVSLAECPTPSLVAGVSCGLAPVQGALTTDRTGTASGTVFIEYSPPGFQAAFDQTSCLPECQLVATSPRSASAAAAIGNTALTFVAVSVPLLPGPIGPPGFGVEAASFVSPEQGWVLGTAECGGSCIGVASTTEGGDAWSLLPTPPTTSWWYSQVPSAVSNIEFANTSDGYIFAPGLWATTNGGRTWTAQDVADVRSLTVVGSYVYVLTGFAEAATEQLYRSTVGSNIWQLVSLPVDPALGESFEVAASGTDAVLFAQGFSGPGATASELGQLWISADQGNHWEDRTVPCQTTDGGAAALAVAYGYPEAWLIDCYDNLGFSQLQNTVQHIYGTVDGGRTWVRLGDPPQHNGPELIADNGGGHALIATLGGSGDTLNGTLDGGLVWNVEIMDGGSLSGWAGLEFVTANVGFVVGFTHSPTGHLYRTTDGGATWTQLNDPTDLAR